MAFDVYTSIAPNSSMIYHQSGCCYKKRIKGRNRMAMSIYVAFEKGMKPCKCCCGLQADVKHNEKELKALSDSHKADYMYDKVTNTLYIRTKQGFWKIFEEPLTGKYLLFHRNSSYEDISFEVGRKGNYHRQKDVAHTFDLMRLIDYLTEHDKAKAIIKEDYRLLPRTTKKQKKYYKIAESKALRNQRRNDTRRLFSIFEKIEMQNPGYRELSFC